MNVHCQYCRQEITMLGGAYFNNGWYHRKCWNQMHDEVRESHCSVPVEQYKRDKRRMEIEGK